VNPLQCLPKIIGLLGTNKNAPHVPGIQNHDHQPTPGKISGLYGITESKQKRPALWNQKGRHNQVPILNPGAGRIPGTLLVSMWVVVKKPFDLETNVRLYLFTSLLMPKDLG